MITSATRHHSWKKINYRRTGTLLAAEFLHGLYQRHDPFLNPFRFANTIVHFQPWETTSYAPDQEWDRLAARFGGRILASPDVIFTELDRVLANPRTRSREMARQLAATDFDRPSDDALAELLVQAHHVPLGEIYEVNLVQVEHALHAAAKALTAEHGAAGGELLARLITSDVPTAGGQSERDFLDLVVRARRTPGFSAADLAAGLDELASHHRELGAAYGADTATRELIEQRFHRYAELDDDELTRRLRAADPKRAAVLGPTAGPELQRVLDFLRRTGEVRDSNKQLLGTITKHRGRMLEAIARRRRIDPEATRLYTLEELLRLLAEGIEVPGEVLNRRRASGIVFRRAESFGYADGTDLPASILATSGAGAGRSVLRGTCASPGLYSGRVTVVGSAADLSRMSVGDVLVAAGTDFDLLLLLQMAGAIVTEEGGLLSHAAVVARELGIPCLIGITDACRLLADGDQVTVRATEGRLEIGSDRAGDRPDPTGTVAAGPAGNPRLVRLDADLPVEMIGRKAAGLVWLHALGVNVPEPSFVLPADVCREIAEQVTDGSDTLIATVAREIIDAVPGHRLSLRSSSLLEDSADGTAAGIYHSEVGVPRDPAAVVEALRNVVLSRRSDRARTYHERHGRSADAPLAVLVAPYAEFTYQGTAFSHSPWSDDHVAIEYFESPGDSGCPTEGGTILHLRHDEAVTGNGSPAIPHVVHDLREVAELAVRVAKELGTPAEIEWGVVDHRVTLVQARSIQSGTAAHTA